MALRAMNNNEKANAKILKQNGFHVFWQYNGPDKGSYWATHSKLICQYCINTKADQALKDLSVIPSNQTSLFK
jgi:hypothetical protein